LIPTPKGDIRSLPYYSLPHALISSLPPGVILDQQKLAEKEIHFSPIPMGDILSDDKTSLDKKGFTDAITMGDMIEENLDLNYFLSLYVGVIPFLAWGILLLALSFYPHMQG